MHPRLAKLNEQRDLILRHLHWIEQEIAAETQGDSDPETVVNASIPLLFDQAAPPESAASHPTNAPETNEIPVFLPDPTEEANVKSLKNDVRKGCLIYFGVACLLLAAGVVFVYLAYN